MAFKYINTNGISHISPVEGTTDWYWGTDYATGDLYEAEEIFHNQGKITSNRLVFIKFPEGAVYEPFRAKAGQ